MNRSDGLVLRRRVVNGSSSSSGLNQDASNEGANDPILETDGSSPKDLNSNPTIDDYSDKETRLTLMEEVLLLGLKDKEVHSNPIIMYVEFFNHISYRVILLFGMIV